MISSGGKSMAYIGDLTHHPVLLMEKPLTEFAYDTDPKQSAQTRVKMLTRFATEKTPIVAYHFAWPGFGHVAKQGDGFRYYPGADEHGVVGLRFLLPAQPGQKVPKAAGLRRMRGISPPAAPLRRWPLAHPLPARAGRGSREAGAHLTPPPRSAARACVQRSTGWRAARVSSSRRRGA